MGSDKSEAGEIPGLCLSNRDANEGARLSTKGSHWGQYPGKALCRNVAAKVNQKAASCGPSR